jgi:hypothetical protein
VDANRQISLGEYAAQGYQVHVIDADPKKRLVKWAATKAKPQAITVSEANSATIRCEIEKARASTNLVLMAGQIDLAFSDPIAALPQVNAGTKGFGCPRARRGTLSPNSMQRLWSNYSPLRGVVTRV